MSNAQPAGHAADEVLGHLFTAVVDEMGWILVRSAYTTFVRETQDCAVALLTPQGEVFAYSRSTGVPSFMGLPMTEAVGAFDDWAPGDVMITNDPYSTDGMVTHLNDILTFKPIFDESGTLLCFAFAFMHCTDIGGAVPGSINVANTEIFQEGLRLRPIRLYKGGRANGELWNILDDNSRIPALNRGDLSALVSALNRAEVRVKGLVSKYGSDPLRRAAAHVMSHSEEAARAALAKIPRGDYEFTEYFEDDYSSGTPVAIVVTVRSNGLGDVELDFTGTDPQVRSAINLPSGSAACHPFVARALINYILTEAPDIRFNAGLLRTIRTTLPVGSVVNARFPAACGMRAATTLRVHDAVLGALIQAIPDRIPAGGASQMTTVYVATSSLGSIGHVVVANPVQGGSGGGYGNDGLSGSDRPVAFLRNVPTEILELEAPVIVEQFGLIPDSEGAGQFRGGFGIAFTVRLTDPDAVLVMRGKDRHVFSPWGARGGRAGSTSTCEAYFEGEEPRYLGKETVCRPELGERIRVTGSGGGGYGPPTRRDPEAVRRDCVNGLVTVERARDLYGVVIRYGKVDRVETAVLRSELEGEPITESFDYGAGRAAWERRKGLDGEQLSNWIWSLPAEARDFARVNAYRQLADGSAEIDGIISDVGVLLGLQRSDG